MALRIYLLDCFRSLTSVLSRRFNFMVVLYTGDSVVVGCHVGIQSLLDSVVVENKPLKILKTLKGFVPLKKPDELFYVRP